MAIAMGCRCGHQFNVKDQYAGKRIKCPACMRVLDIPEGSEPAEEQVLPRMSYAAAGTATVPSPTSESHKAVPAFQVESAPPASLPDPPKPKQYKVLTQKDKWFSGKFDPEKLEGALNAYAGQGWTLKAATTASVPGVLGGNRDEIIFILER